MSMSYHIGQKCVKPKGGTHPQKLCRMYASKAGKTYDSKTFNLPDATATFFIITSSNFVVRTCHICRSDLLPELNKGDSSWMQLASRQQSASSFGNNFTGLHVCPPENGPGNSKCMKGTPFEICLFFVEQLSEGSPNT